ncbi:Asp-tRNA(Asn)/Glu-tRNA(Gln) amidotransferase subunit GatB [Candidatus Roizmanbacteria bacterium]|nr:Asp-tRNA(Asn)/Glu-tRNA(Gln) amidotransferase subunit GatB [Candidatus Roizmanbacteria bacterium]
MINNYKLILGLEIHLQLSTSTKMFCSCKNEPFGSEPNTHVCPVCLGLPGAMPVPNRDAIEKAQMMAETLGTTLQKQIIFERKNYFYPDLPKAFQLTTPHYPVGKGGKYTLLFPPKYANKQISKYPNGYTIGWREIHIEEDTAKSQHRNGKTYIDFNKSGVPLLEMVTEPDFQSIDDAVEFGKEIQSIARYLGVSEADMEKGQLRLEANISLKKIKKTELPDYRVELKNINSFMFMKNALDSEVKRQVEALDRGERLVQETRGYDAVTKKTFTQRGKEEAHDYRYFPEPDIPAISIKYKVLSITYKTPSDYVEKLKKYNIRLSYIPVLIANKQLADFTLKVIKLGEKHPITADMIAGTIVNKKVDPNTTSPEKLLKNLVLSKSSVVSDQSQLREWVEQAIKENPKAVADYKAGKQAVIGVLIGAVMKLSKGKADAVATRQILIKLLQ